MATFPYPIHSKIKISVRYFEVLDCCNVYFIDDCLILTNLNKYTYVVVSAIL